MKTKLLVVMLSVACVFSMLAGLSIAREQNSNSGQSGNANRGGSQGNSTAGRASNSADMKFAMTAAQDGMTEVELGRLAVQKGTSDAVKQFGQRMIDDHTNANQQLMQLASSKGMSLPTALDAKHQAMVAKFQRMSGAAFDRAYAKQMVQDHRKAVDLFQKEADRGMEADLKAFASQTLPTLRGHLSMAQALNTGGGNTGGNANGNTGSGMTGNMNGSGNGNMGGNTNSNMGGGNTNANRNRNSNRGGNMNSNTGGNANNSNRK
jgi:putative membrane protein